MSQLNYDRSLAKNIQGVFSRLDLQKILPIPGPNLSPDAIETF